MFFFLEMLQNKRPGAGLWQKNYSSFIQDGTRKMLF